MKTALFTNFTNETFVGAYNGKTQVFKPGESVYMKEELARHYAKHLVNRELLRLDKNGNLVYKGGDRMTSPKRPEDVPLFVELFNKAVFVEPTEKDEQAIEMEVLNKNKAVEKEDTKKPSLSIPPADDEDDSEESFGGAPKDEVTQPNA